MFKKLFFIAFFALFLISPWQNSFVQAETGVDEVYLFTSPTCPHCTSAKKFLENLKKEQGLNFSIYDYDISKNIEKLKVFYADYLVPRNQQGAVPAIFVGDKYFIGFGEKTGSEIKAILMKQEIGGEAENDTTKEIKEDETVKLPFLGEVDLLSFSLPVLAIILGIVDGFNVCSLGALMVILGLVMILKSRRRVFFFGGAFILTTAIIYGVLIFLWHQFFSFVAPHIRSMEILIGLLALGGGIYLLREFYKACKFGPVCSSNNIMSRLTPKIEKVFQKKASWAIVLGAVVLFAIAVTIIEFPCSAFLPVIFTSILVDSGIALSTSIFYIGLYMIFYMLDEVIIFIIAVLTLNIKIVSPRFIIFFNLLAALIFIFLGVYYLFGWLA